MTATTNVLTVLPHMEFVLDVLPNITLMKKNKPVTNAMNQIVKSVTAMVIAWYTLKRGYSYPTIFK